MTSASEDCAAELRRLAGASSVVNVVARHVDGLVQLCPEQLPGWLKDLGVPPGWGIALVEGGNVAPSRIAVYGPHSDGRWDGCETITVFGFTGEPPEEVMREHADCTLRDLGGDDITTSTPAASLIPRVTAVRGSGYLTAAGRRVWTQHSVYVVGSNAPGEGRLIQHSLFVDASCQARLADDIAQLSNALQRAFLRSIDRR